MKVRDLVKEIEECRKEYGDDFLDWAVYTEQIDEIDKKYKKGKQQWLYITVSEAGSKWKHITDGEKWEYFECAGWWTKFPDKKIFTINVNY